jgi:protein phosphatase
MNIQVPELSLVLLIGPSGSGKSSFGRKHFLPTEVISSDRCRALIADNENDQTVTAEAFDLVHTIVRKRLALGRFTVVDATNVQPEARKPLVELAREYHVFPVAIVFDLPEKLCHERNANRRDRQFGPHVVRNQAQQLRRSLRGLEREGFRYVFRMDSQEEVDQSVIERQPLWNNRRGDHGPFDIVGDVHGCLDELLELMDQLGYKAERDADGYSVTPPEGRRLAFVGDLVDRGLATPEVLRLVMGMVSAGKAVCVPGNHDVKLVRALKGRDVQLTHGLAESMQQLREQPEGFRTAAAKFLDGLISHYVFDDGNLVIAHAGLKESMQGRGSAKVRDFALYGETTGETDDFGLPVRYNWSADYRGKALVVYGHTPVPEPLWLNNTVNIDTGCVFGGKLTVLRYPEREIVSVKAHATYYESRRPFLPADEVAERAAQHIADDVLDIADVVGKRIVDTRLTPRITIREENAMAALEVMSRFAVEPKWIIYLPPTMSPSETTKLPGLLEHPQEAFAYYRNEGIPRVVCEQKHMGSRAVVIVCKGEQVAISRFGILNPSLGTVYTRTGRPFFSDTALEREFLARVQAAVKQSGLWEELGTEWVCLDCELMPWSVKAQELLRSQYAPVGTSGLHALEAAQSLLSQAVATEGVAELIVRTEQRLNALAKYREAYRHYCWPVASIDDLRLAPFHLLASEGSVHADKTHVWHMEMLARICAADERLLSATPYREVDVTDPASCEAATEWWNTLTGSGNEGMVVKPLSFISKGRRGFAQPAIKCRGPEYLRIIYGPEYLLPENLERLRARGVGAKRSLASREFALGIEALERFVRREPLRRTHECVFGVLALESEPVDPRL